MVNVLPPVFHVGSNLLGGQNRDGIAFNFVTKPMGDGVGVGPLHREAFLHKEVALILVSLPNPFPHHGIQNRGIRVRVGCSRFALPTLHRTLVNGHDVLLTRKHEGRLGKMLVPTEPLIHPTPWSGTLRRIVVSDVLVIESIRQGVLRDNVEIAPVEVFVALKFLWLKTLR